MRSSEAQPAWGTMSSEAVSKRQALEVLQSAQEGLSVKAVLELQKMEQVSPSMKAAVAAAICMVSGHYESAIQVEPLSLSRAAWPELRALVVKPGQVISALRNFSFAVDGGNVPARVVQLSKECYEASEGSPATEELSLAKAFQSWVQAAWNYWEVVGAKRAQEAAAKAEAKPEERIGTRSTRSSALSASTGSRVSAISGKVRETSSLRPVPVPVRGGNPPSVTQSPKKGGYKSPSSSPGAFGGPKTTLADLEELRFRLHQMKKDTRSIKGMEAALRWDIAREEEKAKQAEQRKDMLDHMQAKAELEHGLQQTFDEALHVTLLQEINDRKNYQEFKRGIRKADKQAALQKMTQNYLEQKEYSEWMVQDKKNKIAEEQRMILEAHLEQNNFISEFKAEERLRQETEEREDRIDAEHKDLQLAFFKANMEKDQAIDALEYARACQRVPVPADVHVPNWHASKT